MMLASLVVALGALLTVQVAHRSSAAAPGSMRPAPRSALPGVVIGLQPYGDAASPWSLARHARILEARFETRVRVLPARALPEHAYDPDRGQVNATRLLDDLYIHRPAEITHSVGVVSEDLYAADWEFLYGFSQASGRVALYSTARLGRDAMSVRDRVEKVMVHEVGHTLGLEHCASTHCLMATVEAARGIDRMSRFFCTECAHRVSAASEDAVRDAGPNLARGDGLYARGAFERAYVHYVGALLRNPFDAERINRVGLVAAELGATRVSERAYRTAIRRAPAFPLPYYNYGLLYASVDPARSAALLQMGFERDADRVEALGYLASVYAEVLGDHHQALAYFQAYVREGGQSPNVLVRYRRLVRPSIFDFDDSEVGVFRASVRANARARLRWRVLRLRWAFDGLLAPLLRPDTLARHSHE